MVLKCRPFGDCVVTSFPAIATPPRAQLLIRLISLLRSIKVIPPTVGKGCLAAQEPIEAGEIVIFERASAAIDIFAKVETEFVPGSAVASPHDLVTGHHSVHTTQASLEAGEHRIKDIEARLRAAGRFNASAALGDAMTYEP